MKRTVRFGEHGGHSLKRAGRRVLQKARRLTSKRGHELAREGGRWWRRLGGRRIEWAYGWLDFRYGTPGEARTCPACAGHDITHLDTLWHFRPDASRYAGFVSGCRTCGLAFANPFPAVDALTDYYDGPDSEYAERKRDVATAAAPQPDVHPVLSRKWPVEALFSTIRDELDVLNPPAGASVLDFGCGQGRLLDSLKARGWATYGIEPAMKSAFVRHRELRSPPAQPMFHLITVNHVLEHVGNPLQVLRSLAAGLLEGGFLYISVPRLDTVAEHGDLKYCINSHRHIVAYTEICLRTLLAMAGLTPIALRNDRELDHLLTAGQPLRQRLLARKLATRPSWPERPLASAERAIAAFYARHPDRAAYRLAPLMPVRLRANWMQRQQQMELAAHRRRKDAAR